MSACGPALPQSSGHAASASVPEPPSPSLAAALTGDPAPPPEDVDPRDRSFAADGDRGVRPPVLGIAAQAGNAPLPSRPPHGEHEAERRADHHAHHH